MKKIVLFILITVIMVFPSITWAQGKSVSFSTYYPAPFGKYNDFSLKCQTEPVGFDTADCTPGNFFANNNDGCALYYCATISNPGGGTFPRWTPLTTWLENDTGGTKDIFQMNLTSDVGIGVRLPLAKLHIVDGAILATGNTGATPVSGSGTRFMWVPAKKALRAGEVGAYGTYWNETSIGMHSTALGLDTQSTGAASVSIGYLNSAYGGYSATVGGTSNETLNTSSDAAILGGNDNYASGNQSVVVGGYSNISSGNHSFSAGYDNTASGNVSAALGYTTTAEAYASTVLGRFNVTNATYNKTAWVDTDPLFVIGNGADATNRANALTLRKDGRLALGGKDSGVATDISAMKLSSGVGIISPDGGIVMHGDYGAGATLSATDTEANEDLGTTNTNNTMFIWYPRKSAVRIGNVVPTSGSFEEGTTGIRYADAFEDANIANRTTISGGGLNVIEGTSTAATIAGGQYNAIDRGSFATISGGTTNKIDYTAISGGSAASWATISGGSTNTAKQQGSSVGGGSNNEAYSYFSRVGGGEDNTAGVDEGLNVGGVWAGEYSVVAGGVTNIASGDKSTIAGGRNGNATGSFSAVLGGDDNDATNPYAVALGGLRARVTGQYATAFPGTDLQAVSLGVAVIGKNNTDTGNPDVWTATDPIFIVGNGASTAARANSLVILKNGTITIGTGVATAATTKLQVNDGDINLESGLSYRYNNGCVAGACISDLTLKKNIQPLSDSLKKVLQLNPSSFEYIDPLYGTGTQLGLIAQDVEKIFPEWITTDTKGNKAVIYGLQLQMHLIEATKELNDKFQNEVESLQKENKQLQDTLDKQQRDIEWLKKRLNSL